MIGKTEKEMIEELDMIASTYLYKDILQLENVRKPRIVTDLVKALALQVGSEVSLNETAGKVRPRQRPKLQVIHL